MRKLTFGLVSLACALSAPAQSGILPVGRPEFRFAYDRMERLDALSLDRVRYQLGPVRFDQAAPDIPEFRFLQELRPGDARFVSFVRADLNARRFSSSQSRESITGGGIGRPLENLFVYAWASLDEARAKDPNYTGKKWRGLAGDVDQAFVWYGRENFELTAGRYAGFWGITRSLIFSPSQNLDGFGYSFHWGKLSISYRLARLDGLNPDIASIAQFENRFLAAHRFDLHFSPRLRVGLFESIVFGGPGRQIDLFYLNPLIFFHGSQLNEGMNDNSFVGFDYSYKPAVGYRLYGQLLIDDLQIDNRTQSDKEPSQIALRTGIYRANLFTDIDVRFEYTRVNNWTFNQLYNRNRYLFNGRPVADVRGNDYDEIDLHLWRWLTPSWRLGLQFSRVRQGEGTITSDWTQPWMNVSGEYAEPFPTATVETTTRLAIGVAGFGLGHVFVDLQTGFDRISNVAHEPGVDRHQPFLSLTLSTFFHPAVDLD